MFRPAYTKQRCSCEEPVLQLEHIQYQLGSGLVDFFCVNCGRFRLSKTMDDLTPYTRRKVRGFWIDCDGECH